MVPMDPMHKFCPGKSIIRNILCFSFGPGLFGSEHPKLIPKWWTPQNEHSRVSNNILVAEESVCNFGGWMEPCFLFELSSLPIEFETLLAFQREQTLAIVILELSYRTAFATTVGALVLWMTAVFYVCTRPLPIHPMTFGTPKTRVAGQDFPDSEK